MLSSHKKVTFTNKNVKFVEKVAAYFTASDTAANNIFKYITVFILQISVDKNGLSLPNFFIENMKEREDGWY